jgi:antitoxin ParD1/3/4
MDILLPPELEEMLRQKVESGQYSSTSEVIQDALWLFYYRDRLQELKLEELRKEIAIGLEQADKGQLTPAEEVFERLRERLEELRKEIQKGLDSGLSKPLDFEVIKARGKERLAQRQANQS